MESLLRLSGLLPDDDEGAMDLGTLEKKLAEKAAASGKELPRDKDSGKALSSPEQEESTSGDTP